MNHMDDVKASRWGTPPAELVLGDDEVHVWRAKLNAPAREVEGMVALLTRAERREMKRADKPAHYASARHLVRTLLGRYLSRDPAKLRLGRGPDGCLRLDEEGAPHFFMDTTRGRALFAISATQRVALAYDEVPSDEEVRERITSLPSREARQLEFLSPQNRASAVIGYQVEREAMERLVGTGGTPGSRVERLKVGSSYVAALAADGWDWSPSFWRYWRAEERRSDADADADADAATNG